MENEYFWEMVWKVFWVVVMVVVTVRVAWRKVKEKQKLNDLAMYAIVEAQKQKFKEENKAPTDS